MSDKDNLEKKNNEEFNLYTENIVVKRSVKYRRVIHFGKLLLEAIIFGSVACFAFTALYPWMSDQFVQEDKRTQISIPKDEYPDGNADGIEETSSEDSLNQKTDLPVTDFKNSFEYLSKTMVNTKECIVTVTTNEKDNSTENKNIGNTSGLIIAGTSSEFLILTNYSVVKSANNINVLFNNGNTMSAYLLRGDTETGMAIICVSLSEEITINRTSISVAKLDNSYQIDQGDIVIAAGKILGNDFSVNYGTAINVKTSKSGIDSYYSLISTNMQQLSGDYAYIFNADGNVIGIMKPESIEPVIIAYGISDLKALIEKLSNNQGITYLGVAGVTVTNSIASIYSKPTGVYITEVVENSPAFLAGIQSGDIITSINNETVVTFKSLIDTLYKYKSGDLIVINVKRQGKDEYKNFQFNVTLSTK